MAFVCCVPQLCIFFMKRSSTDHPWRACQLTYDLLKCNHPDVRSGLLFIPTGTRGICFDISKICITGRVRERVIKCASAFFSEVASMLAAQFTACPISVSDFGFSCRTCHVTFITSGSPNHTGRMTWWGLPGSNPKQNRIAFPRERLIQCPMARLETHKHLEWPLLWTNCGWGSNRSR